MQANDGIKSPIRTSLGAPSSRARLVAISLLLAVGVLTSVVSWAALRTGSVRAGIAYLAGDDFYLSAHTLTVSGSGLDVRQVEVVNLSDQPIRILGYNAQCTCVSVSGCPARLGKLESSKFTIRAVSATTQVVPVVFISDHPSNPPMRVDVTVAGTDG
jgi:hypothetical protein